MFEKFSKQEIKDNGEFARMLTEREKQELGQVKTGKVIAIHDNGLLVDVGEEDRGVFRASRSR